MWSRRPCGNQGCGVDRGRGVHGGRVGDRGRGVHGGHVVTEAVGWMEAMWSLTKAVGYTEAMWSRRPWDHGGCGVH